MSRVICGGLIAVDLVFAIEDYPMKGTKNRAASSRLITGGGALNAASAIAALGANAVLAGAIGDDAFGRFLQSKMSERGIDDQLINVIAGSSTSRSANFITADGDRTIVNHRDESLVPKDFALPPDFGFDAALVDTRWPSGAARIIDAAVRAGKPSVIDAEQPIAHAKASLERASHVVFSEQGLADYCSADASEALSKAAQKLGCWCAVTRGSAPVLCHDGQSLTEIPTFQTKAVNTLGAGDVWHAAFTLALCQKRSEAEAVRWANAVAALKVSRSIDVETLPSNAEVEAFMRSN